MLKLLLGDGQPRHLMAASGRHLGETAPAAADLENPGRFRKLQRIEHQIVFCRLSRLEAHRVAGEEPDE